jgi:hypothetical protein
MEAPHKATARRFWLLAGLSLAGYLILRLWMPLAPYAAPIQRPDVTAFAPWPRGSLAYAALLLALFWAYWQAYRTVISSGRPLPLVQILLPAALFSVLLIGAFPINALDIYNYLLLGRVQAVFGHNPYLVSSAAIPQEIWLPYGGEWGGDTSPYGPVFQLAASAVAGGAGDNLLLGLVLFKVLAALAMLGSAALIWLLLARASPNRRAAHTLLWAWNPALLLTFVMNAHNDGLMIFWLLAGLWLAQRGQRVLGFAVMLLAPLIKLSGLMPIPFLLLAALQSLPTLRSRIRLLLGVALAWLLVAGAAFLPYGSPLLLIERLARTAIGSGYSPLTLLLMVSDAMGLPTAIEWLAGVGLALLTLVGVTLLWRTWRGRSAYRAAADINVAYTLLSLGFRIWYATWPFPWLVIDAPDAQGVAAQDSRNQRLRTFRLRAGVLYLITSQLSVLIYGAMRLALLGESLFWAHVVGVAFTFGLPLVLAWLSTRRAPRGRRRPVMV